MVVVVVEGVAAEAGAEDAADKAMMRDGCTVERKCRAFTLQWHLTNRCAASCKHCYDRSNRSEPTFEQALRFLSELKSLCKQSKVAPQVSLSGGDPLLYPHFDDLYRVIARDNLPVSILGNPIPPAKIEQLCAVSKPVYYQISLEGLQDHNDFIRGKGHFDRALQFLLDARIHGLNTSVMLTLTKANIDQVLPLAEILRGLTARFSFNRLAQVGEGAALELPSRAEYACFLERYLQERMSNPILGVKENLLNVVRFRAGRSSFRGCTGYGCGAAFNFVALLPDGEVHACRKYPSPLGNLHRSSLAEIYHSKIAAAYRRGPRECSDCRLRPVCGGCPAVTLGQGLRPLEHRDPFCFL